MRRVTLLCVIGVLATGCEGNKPADPFGPLDEANAKICVSLNDLLAMGETPDQIFRDLQARNGSIDRATFDADVERCQGDG
jgi:hypothetical protein